MYPKAVPKLIEPVRVDDSGLSSSVVLQSWDEWQAETARVAVLPSATQIAHLASAVREGVLSEYRSAGLVFQLNLVAVVAPSGGSVEVGRTWVLLTRATGEPVSRVTWCLRGPTHPRVYVGRLRRATPR